MAVATKTLTPTNQVVNLPDMTEPPDNSVNVANAGKLADAVNALDSNIVKIYNKEITITCGSQIDAVTKMYNGAADVSAYKPSGTIVAYYAQQIGYTGYEAVGACVGMPYDNVVRCSCQYQSAEIIIRITWIYK